MTGQGVVRVELLPEIESRRSIREFLDQPVDKAAVNRIIEAGRRAPSAKNRQAWRFIVVRDPEVRRRIQEAAFYEESVGTAPVIIALCTTNIEYQMPNGQLSYPVDMGMAGAFMMLQAQHEGLGSCIVTTFREPEVKTALSVPYRMRIVMLLLVGHAKSQPEASRRFPIERVVGYEHW